MEFHPVGETAKIGMECARQRGAACTLLSNSVNFSTLGRFTEIKRSKQTLLIVLDARSDHFRCLRQVAVLPLAARVNFSLEVFLHHQESLARWVDSAQDCYKIGIAQRSMDRNSVAWSSGGMASSTRYLSLDCSLSPKESLRLCHEPCPLVTSQDAIHLQEDLHRGRRQFGGNDGGS